MGRAYGVVCAPVSFRVEFSDLFRVKEGLCVPGCSTVRSRSFDDARAGNYLRDNENPFAGAV